MKAAWLLYSPVLLSPMAVAAGDLLVVDPEGIPVPGVTIEFVETPVGAFGDFSEPLRRQSDEGGFVSLEDVETAPLDFRVANTSGASDDVASWAIRFVHGHRTVDEAAAPDLLGVRPRPYDLDGTILCVVEPLATIRVRVVGAKPDDRFHATFVDKRPEPESHRNVQRGASFQGPDGVLRVPAGRGTLYLAQDGYLGAPAITSTGPLMVSVAPGGEASVSVRFLEGPTAKLLAPFDVIPFKRIEALAPDGSTVIADLTFDASPLKLGCRVPVVTGTANSPQELPSLRLPKQLLRAVDVPLSLPPIEELSAETGVPRMVDRAPMELLFTVDPGDKVRLPEVAGGWINEAQGGLALVSGSIYGASQDTGVRRPKLGQVILPATRAAEPWTARVTVRDASGTPRPFVEMLVSIPGALLTRAVTDAEGQLLLSGIRGDNVAIGLVDSVADHVVVAPPSAAPSSTELSPEAMPAEVDLTQGARIHVAGTWKRSAPRASVGDLLVLIPADAEEMRERRRFMTRAAPIAFVDANGNFDFGSVPRGLYTLRAGREGEASLDLRALESGSGHTTAARSQLTLEGAGDSFRAEVSESD